MSGVAVAVLVLSVAAGAAVQASGLGGPVALAVALVLVLGAVAYLVRVRRRSPVHRLAEFLSTRNVVAPLDDDAPEDHDEDTIDVYRRLHGTSVNRLIRRLRKRGIIGDREASRLSNPRTVGDLQRLLNRLRACEGELD